jgi:hypothetical protein
VVLVATPARADTDVAITGVLVSGGVPVSGGVVYSTSTWASASTASDGSFTLMVPSGEATGLRFWDGQATRVDTQLVTPSAPTSVGTVSMPTSTTTHYRVVDADGTPVFRAYVERDSIVHLTASNWAGYGYSMNGGTSSLPLTAAGGEWSYSTWTDAAGVVAFRHPVLTEPTHLIDTATFDQREADFTAMTGSGAQADPFTVPIPGFQVQPPTAATEVTGSQLSPVFPTFVTWRAGTPRGARVTAYTITASPGGRSVTFSTEGMSDLSDTHSASVPDLRDGTYTFTVVAHSAVGDSAPSAASAPLRVIGIPDAPSSVSASAPDHTNVQVSWAPVTTTATTGYKVTLSNGAVAVVGPEVTSARLGAGAGQTVTASVVTLNQGLESSPATSGPVTVPRPTVAPPPPPLLQFTGQVGKPTAKVKGTKVTLAWQAPADGRLPITKYKVLRKPGKAVTVTGDRRKLVVKGLAPGVHRFAVVAYSAAGAGKASAWVKVRVR